MLTKEELLQKAETEGWEYISEYQILSEEFIREFQDRVNWFYISAHQTLSDEFRKEFQDRVNWDYISAYQTLSEEFIREFQDRVYWDYISTHQTLSEEFIREFKDRVDWFYISAYQTLSEEFIREFQDRVNWGCISANQKLSEEFIREFQDRVNWGCISANQKLSDEFRKEFKIDTPENSWLYTPTKEKVKYLKENTPYKVVENGSFPYILAYKSVRSNMSSVFQPGFRYKIGGTYTAHCDCSIFTENSFGLSACTKEEALKYYNKGKLLLVKIYVKDIGAVVHDGSKIRCWKQTILEEVDFSS